MKRLALMLGTILLVGASASAKEIIAEPLVAIEPVVVVEEAPQGVSLQDYITKGTVDNKEQNEAIYKRSRANYKGFRAVSVGQEIEYETRNTDPANTLKINTGAKFAYGDNWTYSVSGRKDYKNRKGNDSDISLSGEASRIQLGAKRSFVYDNGIKASLGARWRTYSDKDEFFMDPTISYDRYSYWGTFGYKRFDNGVDKFYSESEPLKIALGPFALSYYYEYEKINGRGNGDYFFEHQARLSYPLYTGEKLTLTGEYRLGLGKETKGDHETIKGIENDYKFGNRNTLYFYGSYAMTENLDLGAYLGLEAGKWEMAANEGNGKSYYMDYGVTWEYKF